MPTLKAVFDTAEAAPEGLRPFLVEQNGKWIPDIEIDADPRVAPLKNAFERVKHENQQRGDQLKAWADLGLTVEQMREKITAAEKAGTRKADDDSALKQATEKWNAEQKALTDRLAAKDRTIYDLVARDAATQEITKAKGNTTLLLPHVLGQVKVIEDSGKYRAIVVGADGAPRVKDHLGNPMDISDLVGEMAKQDAFAAAFEGKIPSGSGASGARNGAAPGGAVSVSREASKRNPALYRAAKEEAAKRGVQVQFTD